MASESKPDSPTSGAERRGSPRFPCERKLFCTPLGGGLAARRQVQVRNVSRTGIAFVVDRCWEVGTIVVVELPTTSGTASVQARVVHATMQLGGRFLIGCVLDIQFSEAELQLLTSS